jgi:hypothetical protein
MNRKMFAFCFCSIMLFAAASHSQTTAWVGLFSEYLVQPGYAPYTKPIVVGDVTWTAKSGIYVDAWAFAGENVKSETDWTIGWANKCLDVSGAYYAHAGGGPSNVARSAFKIGCPMQLGSHTLKPYFEWNSMTVLNSHGNDGMLWRVGASDAWSLNDKLTLAQSGWLLYDSGVFKGQNGFTARYELGLAIKQTNCTLKPLVMVSVPVNVTDRETQVVAGFKVIL